MGFRVVFRGERKVEKAAQKGTRMVEKVEEN